LNSSLVRIGTLLAGLCIAAVALSSCGGGGGGGKGGSLTATANADPFAGPAPLAVRFTASAKNPKGKVIYHWRFDDGTSSGAQNPAHTFPRPGYYTVQMDIFDQDGRNARQNLLLGVWGAQEWAVSQKVPLTRKRALSAQAKQRKRTTKRTLELGKRLHQELAGALQ
jgi:hypothetical protein